MTYKLTKQEYKEQRWQQLVSLLNDVLAQKIGITEACRSITGFRFEPGFDNDLFLTFVGVDSETDAFPLGEVREHWDKKALIRMDAERLAAEEFYKKMVFEAAYKLLRFALRQLH